MAIPYAAEGVGRTVDGVTLVSRTITLLMWFLVGGAILGLLDSLPLLYPQLRDLDFIEQAPKLDVPVYFLVGREDVNAVASLIERYYNVLDAPYKELIWLDGGHGASPEQLAETLVSKVLPQTYGKQVWTTCPS